MRQRIFYITFLFVSLTIFGQDYTKNENLATTPTTYQTNDVNLNDQILKYQEFLRDEAKLHREYTQGYYTMILTVFGIFGAVLTWFGWKSIASIKKQVDQLVNEKIMGFLDLHQGTIDEKLKAIHESFGKCKELHAQFLNAKILKCTKCVVGFTSYNENKGNEANPICETCADKIVKQFADNVSNASNIVEN